MTSIYDIPYEDIQIFLSANNRNIKNKDDAYDEFLILLKDKKAQGHTISIIEWMIAHNLSLKRINIPNFTVSEIDNMSQIEIDQLAKLLTMSGNNPENIKNILRYLHKLEEIEPLLPEIQDIILSNLSKLELKDINASNLNAYDAIDLLNTHRSKKDARKFIYDNMQKILSYNFLNTNFDVLTNNNKKLIKRYDREEVNKSTNYIFFKGDILKIDLVRINMDILVNFIIKLAEINELELVKIAIHLINEYKFPRGFPFNYYLTEKIVHGIDDINMSITLIEIIGEDEFFKEFENVIKYNLIGKSYLSRFLKGLVVLGEDELLLRSLQILVDKDYTGNKKVIYKILQAIKKAIRLKDNNKIIRYIDIIGTMSFLNTVKSGNSVTNSRVLTNFNKLIKEAEETK